MTALLLPALVLAALSARPAAAADWTLAPAAGDFGTGRQSFAYTLAPGGRARDAVTIANGGAAPLRVSLRPAAGVTTRAGRLALVTSGAAARNPTAWVKPARAELTVAAGASVEVPFAVAPPQGAAAGDYVGGIVATPAAGAGPRLAIPIRLRVGGAIEPGLEVSRVRVRYDGAANPLGKGDATVTYTIRNSGNATLRAQPKLSLAGPFGSGAVAAGRLAVTPPLLPGERWTVSAPVHGVRPALRLTAKVAVVPLLTDAAGSTTPLAATTASGHAWTIPWALLAAVVLLAAAALTVVRRARRRVKHA